MHCSVSLLGQRIAVHAAKNCGQGGPLLPGWCAVQCCVPAHNCPDCVELHKWYTNGAGYAAWFKNFHVLPLMRGDRRGPAHAIHRTPEVWLARGARPRQMTSQLSGHVRYPNPREAQRHPTVHRTKITPFTLADDDRVNAL